MFNRLRDYSTNYLPTRDDARSTILFKVIFLASSISQPEIILVAAAKDILRIIGSKLLDTCRRRNQTNAFSARAAIEANSALLDEDYLVSNPAETVILIQPTSLRI
jgi:hypothetical protein